MIERSKKFYTDLLGWKIEKWPGTDIARTNAPSLVRHENTSFEDISSIRAPKHLIPCITIDHYFGHNYECNIGYLRRRAPGRHTFEAIQNVDGILKEELESLDYHQLLTSNIRPAALNVHFRKEILIACESYMLI